MDLLQSQPDKQSKAVLVTGGAGFIGSNLVDKLLEIGYRVVVIDDFSSGKEGNLIKHKNNPSLIIYKRSITDCLDDIFKTYKIDSIFHLAAKLSIPYSIEHPIETHDVNVNGILNLLNTCKNFNVGKFILSSSYAVYGEQKNLPFTEDLHPNPVNPYGLHKWMSEQYCKLFSSLYGIKTVILRYSNVYGPRQNPLGEYASLIPKFITLINKEIAPTINGDGNQTRDFVFVSDVVDANIIALNLADKMCCDIFNVGSGNEISVNEIAERIIKLKGKCIEPVHGPPLTEIKRAFLSSQKAGDLLKWVPKVSLEEGLKITYKSLAGV